QFGMFIHCHPHLSILDLFLIRQMVPFSLPRFAKNIDSTYIEEEFSEIYEEEKDKITIEDYIKIDSEEFFAGIFGYLYSPYPQIREQIQREAPKTCEFIKNLVENYQPDESTEAA
ncbi:anthrax toxin lethal factor-related metalloendopeptidase, partial [Paenibacillus larvae]|nr:hypothetical protein [Paenibacillus larvae]